MANAFDKRPLNQRFDLTYVRQRTWPKRQYQLYSLVLALAALGYVAYAAVVGDQRLYSSGDIARVHAWFADDCAQCHEPDPNRHGYWLAARDESCLKCHVAEAHHPLTAVHPRLMMNVHDRLGPIDMAARCIDCHVEHQGYDHDLNQVSDAACVACHQNLDAYRHSKPAAASPQPAAASTASTTEGQP
jgi:hypothetical protein